MDRPLRELLEEYRRQNPGSWEAIRRQLECGTVLGAPTELEVELAEELLRRLQGADRIRFTPSGTFNAHPSSWPQATPD